MSGRNLRLGITDGLLVLLTWWLLCHVGYAQPAKVCDSQRAVCRLQIRGSGGATYHGSGVLIAPETVVTAAHNVRNTKGRVRCLFMFARAGSPAGEVWGDVVERSARSIDTALVRLDRRPGVQEVTLAQRDAAVGDSVWFVGYPGSSLHLDTIPATVQRHYDYAIFGGVGRSCVVPGHSGGAAFNRAGRLLGVISGADPGKRESIALNASGTSKWLSSVSQNSGVT